MELITKPPKQGKWSPEPEVHVEVGLSARKPEVAPEVAPDSFMTSLRGPHCISLLQMQEVSQQDSIVNWLAGNVSCSERLPWSEKMEPEGHALPDAEDLVPLEQSAASPKRLTDNLTNPSKAVIAWDSGPQLDEYDSIPVHPAPKYNGMIVDPSGDTSFPPAPRGNNPFALHT